MYNYFGMAFAVFVVFIIIYCKRCTKLAHTFLLHICFCSHPFIYVLPFSVFSAFIYNNRFETAGTFLSSYLGVTLRENKKRNTYTNDSKIWFFNGMTWPPTRYQYTNQKSKLGKYKIPTSIFNKVRVLSNSIDYKRSLNTWIDCFFFVNGGTI